MEFLGRRHGASKGATSRQKSQKALESLAKIALKHEVNATDLIDIIIESLSKKQSQSANLSVECRKKTEDSVVLLFSDSGDIIAQFTIPLLILQRPKQLQAYIEYYRKDK